MTESRPICSAGSGRLCDPDCMLPCHSPAQMEQIRTTGELREKRHRVLDEAAAAGFFGDPVTPD